MRDSSGDAQNLAAGHFEFGSFGGTFGSDSPLDPAGHDEGDLFAVVLVEGDVASLFQMNSGHQHLFTRDLIGQRSRQQRVGLQQRLRARRNRDLGRVPISELIRQSADRGRRGRVERLRIFNTRSSTDFNRRERDDDEADQCREVGLDSKHVAHPLTDYWYARVNRVTGMSAHRKIANKPSRAQNANGTINQPLMSWNELATLSSA